MEVLTWIISGAAFVVATAALVLAIRGARQVRR